MNETNPMIPAEAVEVAAKAIWNNARIDPWEDAHDYLTSEYRNDARLALEAAAPHMNLRELLHGVQREIDEAKTMTDILVDHQRQNSSGCLCGWAKLGHSHPEHQADALSAAGFGKVTK